MITLETLLKLRDRMHWNSQSHSDYARMWALIEQTQLADKARKALCEDEGCPHHGTAQCVPNASITSDYGGFK